MGRSDGGGRLLKYLFYITLVVPLIVIVVLFYTYFCMFPFFTLILPSDTRGAV